MPQPLYKVNKRAAFFISSSPGSDRSAFAVSITDVIAAGASLEVWLGCCLARMLGATHAETGIAMYSALNSGSAQRDVITAAANSVLKGDDLSLFLALLQLAFKASRRRNDIAHGIWGFSPDILDGILLIPPRIYLQWHGKGEATGAKENVIDTGSILVYKKSDFMDITQKISAARNNLQWFWMYLDPNETSELRDQSRQKLYNEPDVQRELLRIQKGQQNSPSAPPQSPHSTGRG